MRTAVVTRRDDLPVRDSLIARTPAGMPDVCVKVLSPVARVLVRSLRVYLMTLLGLLGAGVVGGYMPQPFDTFYAALRVAATTALAPAIVSALWNTLELVQGWDDSHPEMRG